MTLPSIASPWRRDERRYVARMRSREVRLVALGQATYLAGLGVCLAIRPGYLTSADEGGISNFGVHAVTVVPFTFAFLGAAALLAIAARATVPSNDLERRFAAALWALAAILVVVLASTYGYQRAAWLRALHIDLAIAGTVVQALLACWLVARVRHGVPDFAALVAMTAALALAGCSLAGVVHVLLATQLAGALAFGVLLVRAAATLAHDGS
jgi:hypothetical protein